MKTCTHCHLPKELSEFYRRNASRDKLNSWCKTCSIANVIKFTKNHADRCRRTQKGSKLKRKHGITLTQWDEMFKKQKGRCAICQRKVPRLCVDHDHTTGKIRGLLCGGCNTALGAFHDSIKSLKRAVRYLRKDRSQPSTQENTVITRPVPPTRWERWLARRTARLGKSTRRVPAQEQTAPAAPITAQ